MWRGRSWKVPEELAPDGSFTGGKGTTGSGVYVTKQEEGTVRAGSGKGRGWNDGSHMKVDGPRGLSFIPKSHGESSFLLTRQEQNQICILETSLLI